MGNTHRTRRNGSESNGIDTSGINRTPSTGRNTGEVCSICGGLGLVKRDVPVGHPDFGKAFPCVCQAEVVRAREAARLRALGNLEAFTDKTFATFEIDHDLVRADETDFPVGVFREMGTTRKLSLSETQRRMIKSAAELAWHYAEGDYRPPWLLFEGNYGTGKTHLAAAIANHRLSYGDPVLFMAVPDLLDHLRGAFGPTSEVAYDEMFERIRKAPLLILDDLGAENSTPWAVEKLYQLFNDRHRLRLPTVITTNRDPGSVEPRIRSRLLDQAMTRSIKLYVPDRRSPSSAWPQSDLTNLDRYREMTFETFDLRAGEGLPATDVTSLRQAAQTAYSFSEAPQGWLVIAGRPGSGKTHLAAGIAHALAGRGTPPLFVVASDLIGHLRATFYPGAAVSYDKRIEEIKSAPVLILDDLSIEEKNMSAWAREKLYEILIYRFDYRLPTVITTAQNVPDMDARLRSRVDNAEHSTVVLITAPHYSGKVSAGKSPSGRRAAPPRG